MPRQQDRDWGKNQQGKGTSSQKGDGGGTRSTGKPTNGPKSESPTR